MKSAANSHLKLNYPRAMLYILYPVPLIVLLIAWQVYAVADPHSQFIFSGPVSVWFSFVHLAGTGELARHAGVTIFEALSGFVLGTTLGAALGLSFWYSRLVAAVARPYVAALGSIPIFALSPMIISWFGIGLVSKIALAFIATVVVAIGQSYQGAMSVETKYLRFMQVVGATQFQTFKTVVVPSSLIWVLNAMKLNIGLALLGAFIGEFISSEQGLGYMIVRASGLYDMATVLVGVFTLVTIALCFTGLVEQMERAFMPWRTIA
jgi:NitT/TauT family transport system permease protein